MRHSELVLLLPLLIAQDRCSGPSSSGEPKPFECELGLLVDDAFVPIGADTEVELQLGFQGFLIVELAARTREHRLPEIVEGSVSLTPEGMDPLGSTGLWVPLERDGDWEVSGPIQVFLDPAQLGAYPGLSAHVALRLEDPDHVCVVQADVVLVDDDPCIHTGAEPECPDDTGTP